MLGQMAALRHFVPMRVFIILIFTAFTTGALAQCPKNPVISEELDEAYRSLKFAKFPRDAQVATDVLWSLWTRAPGQSGATSAQPGDDEPSAWATWRPLRGF